MKQKKQTYAELENQNRYLKEELDRYKKTGFNKIDFGGEIDFHDLFDINEIQKIQDLFAEATGVASIITNPNGIPITKPSNFCRLCIDIIRKTEKGLKNCYHSDAVIGKQNIGGAIYQPCLSGGLWDGGASISVGGNHIANWLIGQVKNENINEEKMLLYAKEIEANEIEFKKALDEVTIMSTEKFKKIADILFYFANEISQKAYHNILQNRFITELQKKEEQLRKAKELAEENELTFRKLFEDSSDAILLIDKTGVFVECNQAALDLLKMTREEFLFKPPVNISPVYQPNGRKSQEAALEMIELAYKKGLHRFDWTCLNAKGEVFIVEVSLMPIIVKGQTMLHTTWRDITNRKEFEVELLKAKEKAEESDRLKTEFINNMSHEIRTPMNGILGFSTFLSNENLTNDKRKHYVNIIQNSGHQLMRIIDDILEISKLGTKQVKISEKEICLNDLLLEHFSIFDINLHFANKNRRKLISITN